MDSPSEYVAKLEAELREAREEARRLARERNDIAQDLAKYRFATTSLSQGAAATAEIAIERLQGAMEIIEAAVEWRTRGAGQSHELHGADAELAALIDAYTRRAEARS